MPDKKGSFKVGRSGWQVGLKFMNNILQGDVIEKLKEIETGTVQCVVTSPPYWGLRDYGIDGQLGLEETPEEYVEKMVEVFRQIKRVLKHDGTVWLNLGDSYNGSGKAGNKNSEYYKKHTEFGKPAKNKDKIGILIKRIFSKKLAHSLIRFKNIIIQIIFFNLCRSFPQSMKKNIIKGAKKQLGNFPVDPHFIPNYKPWEQRFCLAPDGDFFKVIKEGKASIITEHIDHFKKNGILLKSGKMIESDVIITATGLDLLAFGGVEINIDSMPFDVSKSFVYKGVMLSNLPNFFIFVGYTNASWTLKIDLTNEYISRVINYLEKQNHAALKVKVDEDTLSPIPLLNLDSNYINRSANILPKQGDKIPWRLYQNYILDYKLLCIDKIKDEWVKFY